MTKTEECPTCGGSGECQDCDGSGKVEEDDEDE